MNNIDEKIVANIKALAIDMIDEASSGHPGIVLSAAKILYALYAKNIIVNPRDHKWINRDRFVMSAGHGSALLYSILYMSGFDISIDDLKKFRKLSSITPGHPELNVTPGVDISTGPLGQGVSSAVGMAIASKYLSNRYNSQNNKIFDNKIYVLVGDGDLMEGVSLEALSIAGNLNLNNLIILYDSNHMTLDSSTMNTMNENILAKFKRMNFNTILVKDGGDINQIDKAIKQAKNNSKPTIIEIRTILGKDSILENTNKAHGGALSSVDIDQLKKKLGVRNIKFSPSNEAVDFFRKSLNNRVSSIYDKWCDNYSELIDNSNKKVKDELNSLINPNYIIDYNNIFNTQYELISFRDLNNKVLNNLDNNILMNASADLFSACKTKINRFSDFTKDNYLGQNIYMGVREHGMQAIMNGIATYNILAISSTFLSFSDYLKPSIRMSAMMNLKTLNIFTHDSILVGEDGPTHQPIEQLTMLRSIPNYYVYRPSTFNELLGSYENIFINNNPACLIITKNKINEIIKGEKDKVKHGAYIIKKEKYNNKLTILSSGEELQLITQVAIDLEKELNKGIRIISVPCLELFERQTLNYKKTILDENNKIVTFELSNDYKLAKYATKHEYIININEFGISGNKNDILKYFNLDYNNLYEKIKNIIET